MQSENTQLISEQLARFVVWTKFEDIPEELIIKAQRHILDSVGAGIAGAVIRYRRRNERKCSSLGQGY